MEIRVLHLMSLGYTDQGIAERPRHHPGQVSCNFGVGIDHREGRGVGKQSDHIHLHLEHLDPAILHERLPGISESARIFAGVDVTREPIPVLPTVHYNMGGIPTNFHGEVLTKANGDPDTVVPGLMAIGEAACVSVHGANRLGSNSLTECLVFGARSGHAAAVYAQTQPPRSFSSLEALVRDEQRRLDTQFLKKEGGKEPIAQIRVEMNTTMEEGAGIYRNEAEMQKTCNTLRGLRERFADIRIEDRGNVFNTELTSALELDFMLDIAQAVAHSALERKESRGSHTRTDFPKRDDDQYLKHSLAYRTQGEPRVDYLPVTITRWQPEERKY